jgi:DNA-binding transcriptional LysR family regulator
MAMNRSADLQLDWLRAFVAVADTGSLTAAAKQIDRSQSAVSMQLKKLEGALGQSLISRGPRHLFLTTGGVELLHYAQKILDLHTEALTALRGSDVTGGISLGVPEDYAVAYLTSVLRTFSKRYPAVEITLVCEPSTSLISKVEQGELDLAVVTRDRSKRGTLLFREKLVWVGEEHHEAWRRDPLPIAFHDLGSRPRDAVLRAISSQQRRYRIAYHSPNVAGQVAAAESGMAIAILTKCSLPSHLKVLDRRHGLPDLPEVEVVVIRSKQAARLVAPDAMFDHLVRTLKRVNTV